MAVNKDRIILDTNLWISFLITRDYSKLDNILKQRQAILIFSSELLEEFLDVATRPKLKKYISRKDVEGVLASVDEYAEFIEVKATIKICRDSKDNFLLALGKRWQCNSFDNRRQRPS
jgi:putative PIN family toxin of toxin-antitoxin system